MNGKTKKSQLVIDRMPTFYVSKEGGICTHKMGDDFKPVWCDMETALYLIKKVNKK